MRGEDIGALTLGTLPATGRRLETADLEDAAEIVRRAATVLASARLYRDLAASEARYRNVIDTAQEGIWILDAEGRTRYCNERMSEMLGYAPDELYGASMDLVFDPEARAEAHEAFEQRRRGEAGRRETWLLRKDGSSVWVLVASTPLQQSDGRFDGVLAMVNDISDRKALELRYQKLYQREHHVAVTLQRAMLPAVLPTVGGLEFDAVYHPGATEAEIGGDWYDAIALPDGRVLLSIGDVTGRGLPAAVIMGRMRQAIETLVTYEADPVRLLDAADAVLRRADRNAIVTALVGVLDPAQRTLSYATAGHPTPIVRAPDGTTRQLPGRGLPLGLRDGRESPTNVIVLPSSALVAMFTDGLVESTRDIDEGERRVFAALRDPAVADATSPASALVARVLDGAVRDDVAVLTVRVPETTSAARPWTMRWRLDPSDHRRVYDARDVFIETLHSFGDAIDIDAAQLVFRELIGNALRHAPGTIDVELTWDDSGAAVLHIVDDGPGYYPQMQLPSLDAESGRGLYLVAQLARDFTVTKLADRGAHARATLATRER
ncbi:MAG TPA: SpoIIE family protein phosphatase [Candidatus Acidoferrum sp.]|nr:SpoIIE family protein phosphatase [Candidatus Acidoferrum sp.]